MWLLVVQGRSSGSVDDRAQEGKFIERFEFADGTTLSSIVYHAASGVSSLIGTAGHDVINGGAGQENLWGGAGNDTLNAGTGGGGWLAESNG